MRLGPNCPPVVVASLLYAVPALALFPAMALAHASHAGDGGWVDGLVHIVSGLDRVVAMIALGIWASVMGRAAAWLLPAAFLASMAMGAALRFHGVFVPGAEDAVAVSVAVLGVVVAVAAQPPLAVGIGIAGVFGAVQGHAQGAALPQASAPFFYALGLLSAAAALHFAGIAFGLAARSPFGQKLLPVGAAAIAGLGVALILAL